jgi:xylulokinase
MSCVGIDIGTNGCKATAITEDGEIIYHESRSYALSISEGFRAELSPSEVWNAFYDLLKNANNFLKKKDPIEAISFSILGEAITPIDRAGKALDSTLVSMDYRGKDQNSRIMRHIDPYYIYSQTGQICHPMYPLSKILWWKENSPSIYSQTWKFLCWEDYLFLKLCGKPVMSHSLASRTLFFDIKKKIWLKEILNQLDLDENLFSNLLPSGFIVENISPSICNALHIPKNAVLVSGGWDQACAALGAGAITEDVFLESFGTTICVGSISKNLFVNEDLFRSGFPTNCFVKDDTYFINGGTLNGGILLQWYKNNIIGKFKEVGETNKEFYEAIEQYDMNPASEYFIPHFAGSGTPVFNPNERGGILNLSYETNNTAIIKSLFESLGFEVRKNIDFLEWALDRDYSEIRIVGGGSRSEYICKMQSNILNKTIRAFEYHDVSSYGAAILALAGCKGWPTAISVLQGFSLKTRKYYGEEPFRSLYQNKYLNYKRLTQIFSSINETIHSKREGVNV